jgi:N-acetyl-gamma-glutamyl-phosphate reductase
VNKKLVKVGIIGISGYSGCTLLDILLAHPLVRITYVGANSTKGPVGNIWPHLNKRTSLVCKKFDIKKAAEKCEIIFLAVPHTASMEITPKLLKNKVRVIDLSGDYRLRSSVVYQKWYGKAHKDPQGLSKAIYGLPELYREKIKKASLLSNPGCYPTAALLSLTPLVSTQTDAIESIFIDAKSGTTGAGKKATASLMFSSVNENFKAYKVCEHQHTPEIDQYLSRISGKQMSVTFVPHLLPIDRGILETIYVQLSKSVSLDKLVAVYKKFYKTEPFVRVLDKGQQPEIKNVTGTNFCDIGLAINQKKKVLVITAVIDNLMKGAAGQAVQNMNIMYGFNESEGLN